MFIGKDLKDSVVRTPEIKALGSHKDVSFSWAALAVRSRTFFKLLARSDATGVACTAATFTVSRSIEAIAKYNDMRR